MLSVFLVNTKQSTKEIPQEFDRYKAKYKGDLRVSNEIYGK